MADYYDGCAVQAIIMQGAVQSNLHHATSLFVTAGVLTHDNVPSISITGTLKFAQGVVDMTTILSESLTQREIDFAKGVIAAMGGTPAGRKFTILLPGGLSIG